MIKKRKANTNGFPKSISNFLNHIINKFYTDLQIKMSYINIMSLRSLYETKLKTLDTTLYGLYLSTSKLRRPVSTVRYVCQIVYIQIELLSQNH